MSTCLPACFLLSRNLVFIISRTRPFFQCRVVSNGNKRSYTKNMMHHPEYRGTSGNSSCAPAVNKTSLEETARRDKENGQRPSGQKRARFFSCFIVLLIPVTNYLHRYFVERLFKLFWRIPSGNVSKLRVIVWYIKLPYLFLLYNNLQNIKNS